MRWRSAGCCCSAGDPATCWGAAGLQRRHPAVLARLAAARVRPPIRRGCSPRAVQGVGGTFAAPTALALIAVTFPEGPPRNRAMGAYAGMSTAGGAVGLIAGGLLVTLVSWRWVFFVNVPIGILAALAAPRVLREPDRRRGHFDLPGAITGSLGQAALVYGLSNAATSPNGVSHWGDAKVMVSLAAAAVLLAAFGISEVRSRSALMPIRVLRSPDRSSAYLVSPWAPAD